MMGHSKISPCVAQPPPASAGVGMGMGTAATGIGVDVPANARMSSLLWPWWDMPQSQGAPPPCRYSQWASGTSHTDLALNSETKHLLGERGHWPPHLRIRVHTEIH